MQFHPLTVNRFPPTDHWENDSTDFSVPLSGPFGSIFTSGLKILPKASFEVSIIILSAIVHSLY